jgi:acyl transferase domain-containing protein
LQTVYHAIEDAGYNNKDFATGKVGVFVGQMREEYKELYIASDIASVRRQQHCASI